MGGINEAPKHELLAVKDFNNSLIEALNDAEILKLLNTNRKHLLLNVVRSTEKYENVGKPFACECTCGKYHIISDSKVQFNRNILSENILSLKKHSIAQIVLFIFYF